MPTTVDIFETHTIIHFCVPASAFNIKHSVRPDQTVFLHDSVMDTSQRINTTFFHGRATVIHMLMNEDNTIVVANKSPLSLQAKRHLCHLTQRVVLLSIEQHDRVMARSQAPLALLLKTVLNDLEIWHKHGSSWDN